MIEQDLAKYEEAYELFEQTDGEDVPELFIQEKQHAEETLRLNKYWKDELEKRKAHAAEETLLIKRYVKQAEDKLKWHREGLRYYLTANKIQKEKLIYGSFSRRDGNVKAVVTDPTALLNWARERGLENMIGVESWTPDTKKIMALIEDDWEGALPDGVDTEQGAEIMTVTLAK